MPTQEEIKAAKSKIENEFSGHFDDAAIEKFITRISSEHFFDKTDENKTADDIALHDYLSGLYTADRINIFSALATYKAQKTIDMGTSAVNENYRNWGYLEEKPQYGLDFKDAKYNMDVVDKAVSYSTKLLNQKTVDNIKKIDELFALDYFKNERESEQTYIDKVIDELIYKQHNINKEAWGKKYDADLLAEQQREANEMDFSIQVSTPQKGQQYKSPYDNNLAPNSNNNNNDNAEMKKFFAELKEQKQLEWSKTDMANLRSSFAHYYNDGKDVLTSKAPDFATIKLSEDGKTVQITSFKKGFLEEEKRVHEFVQSKRIQEYQEATTASGKLSLPKLHNLTVSDRVDKMATLLAYANAQSHLDDELALQEHKIRSEADYNKRISILQRDKENLKNNPNFVAFTLKATKDSNYTTKSTSFGEKKGHQVLKEWDEYNKEVEKTVNEIINENDVFIPYDRSQNTLTLDEMQKNCKDALNTIRINNSTDYITDMETAANYFTLRLLTEPGAKRTFFGKGTDWSNDEQRKARTGLKASRDGKYFSSTFEISTKQMRNSLLTDKDFLSILAEGKPLDKMYEEYKQRSRQRAADIGDARQVATLKAMKKDAQAEYIKDSKDFVMSEESLKYLIKTKNELDTLYKSGGKFRSKYMKDLYSDLTNLINEASKNGNEKDGYTVKLGRLKLLQVKSSTYQNERKGSFFKNPLTDRGKARLDIVEQLINKTTNIMKEKQPTPEKQIIKQAPAIKN